MEKEQQVMVKRCWLEDEGAKYVRGYLHNVVMMFVVIFFSCVVMLWCYGYYSFLMLRYVVNIANVCCKKIRGMS